MLILILCGFPTADLPLTGKQKYDIGILMHVLYSNPKVLYAPNSTMADDIITKVCEYLLCPIFTWSALAM